MLGYCLNIIKHNAINKKKRIVEYVETMNSKMIKRKELRFTWFDLNIYVYKLKEILAYVPCVHELLCCVCLVCVLGVVE